MTTTIEKNTTPNSKWELTYTFKGEEASHKMAYAVPTNADGSFVDMTLQSEYYKDLFETAKQDIANRMLDIVDFHEEALLDMIDIKYHEWVE
tara:strand:+ start:116 stop:391 length:276 start_codon:yes stop_codon:yes gene_type:complete